MKTAKLLIKKSPGAKDLPTPAYMTAGAAGMDLSAAVEADTPIRPGEIKLISTGISISVPVGYEVQIRPRSGLALKHGITLVNTPGTIDSDYRGTVSLILINLGPAPYTVKRGARLAQMVLQEVTRAEVEEVEDLESTARAAGGFGHTGV